MDDRVQVVSRDDPQRTFPAHIDDALVQKHFYSVDTPTGRKTDVETLLSKVEDAAAWALRRLLDPERRRFPPGPRVREALSLFFAFQLVRGEATRRMIARQWEEISRKVAESMTPAIYRKWHIEEYGEKPSNEEVAEMVSFAHDSSKYTVKMDNEPALHLGMVLRPALDFVPYFERRRWQLLTFDDAQLVTGDEPIALLHPSSRPGEGRVGLRTAPRIAIPVGPTRALVLVRPDLTDREERLLGSAAQAEMINVNVAYGCHRQFVHKPGPNPLAGVTLPEKGPGVIVEGDTIRYEPRPRRRDRLSPS